MSPYAWRFCVGVRRFGPAGMPDALRAVKVPRTTPVCALRGTAVAVGFVGQPRYALLLKPPDPYIDTATADPDGRGDMDDRYPISQE